MTEPTASEHRRAARPDEPVREALRERRRSASMAYARFYAPLAIAVVALTYVPLYPDTVDPVDGTTTSFGTFWDILGSFSGGLVALSVLLLAALVVLLVIGAFAPASPLAPVLTVLAGGGLLAIVVGRPFQGVPRPAIGTGGRIAVAVGVVIVVVAVVHAIHLTMVVHGRSSTVERAVIREDEPQPTPAP